MLPRPNYYIFYNGEQQMPDRRVFHLSDAFIETQEMPSCLEFHAVMLNINRGHNQELMGKCRKLWEYAELIGRIRDFQKAGMDRKDAVEAGVQSCLSEGILEDVLTRFRAEVTNMLLMEYNQEATEAYLRKEAMEIGREEGLAEGFEKGARALICLCRKLGYTREEMSKEIKEQLGVSEKEAERYLILFRDASASK